MDLPRQHRPVTHLPTLVVRPLGPCDEERFLTLRTAIMDEGLTFAKDYQPGITWDEYLALQDNACRGVGLPANTVPYTFLVAEIDGALVGSSDIRHHLTDDLMRWGGHIGYVVAPQFRRRGWGTEILRQTLPLAKALGITRARLTCRVDNIASRRIITACGGTLDATTAGGICQYWIPVG
ncbi:GNAT family N-acetyltransferase [Nocardia sp. NBC_00508]|uniref:GNAT family N-acetyltransferase n=1 Tax=Nocardia sp. NBC_00508 TaxID=2975992 RepID=UPI002E802836|nr:GNAT family N-acetyltransferase [Nocardia sp. NBC_00508]WUD65887.1 GNAT family N-acetyltransferase [Nocardia sp. NBC_00508]